MAQFNLELATPENMTKTVLNMREFQDHKKNYDGICTNCLSWSYGIAEWEGEGYYCNVCENRSVVGAVKALGIGLIDVL